jgi:Mg2+-importing ATPase
MTKQSNQAVAVKTAGKGGAAVLLHAAVAQEAFQTNDALLASLDTTLTGLDEEQIEDRLNRDGSNEVSHEKPPHWSRQLLRTFKNPFIIVLLILAVVQVFITPDDLSGPIIIAVMVSISVLLSFSQEYRSSRAAENLKAMVRNTATVSRRASDGHSERIEVPVSELVAGDIVHLAAGDMVPADMRLLTAKDLFISQAILTGNSPRPLCRSSSTNSIRRTKACSTSPRSATWVPTWSAAPPVRWSCRPVRAPIWARSRAPSPVSACRPASIAASRASAGC